MLSVFVREEEEAHAALHNNTSRVEGEKIATGSDTAAAAQTLCAVSAHTREHLLPPAGRPVIANNQKTAW